MCFGAQRQKAANLQEKVDPLILHPLMKSVKQTVTMLSHVTGGTAKEKTTLKDQTERIKNIKMMQLFIDSSCNWIDDVAHFLRPKGVGMRNSGLNQCANLQLTGVILDLKQAPSALRKNIGILRYRGSQSYTNSKKSKVNTFKMATES